MEIISAKEAHERTICAIPEGMENIASLIFKDIQIESKKGNYGVIYYKGLVDDWFFQELNSPKLRAFFIKLGYEYGYGFGMDSSEKDYISISW